MTKFRFSIFGWVLTKSEDKWRTTVWLLRHMLDLLGTKVGHLGHLLDKCLTRTKWGHTLDICWTDARHRTKVGQKLGYPHWPPAPLILMLYCVVLGTAFYEAEVVIGLSSLPLSQINEARQTAGMWQGHCRWQILDSKGQPHSYHK